MNRKQALGVFHRLYDAYWRLLPPDHTAFPEHGQLCNDYYEAMRALAPSILGKSPCDDGILCDHCHEAYGIHWIRRADPVYVRVYVNVCDPCLASLHAQNLVLPENEMLFTAESEYPR